MEKTHRYRKFLCTLSCVLILSLCVGFAGISGLTVSAAEPIDVVALDEETPIYLDRSYSFEERAADLLSRMTLNQKASQMISGFSPAIPELGMNWYGWWNEALHGVSRLQHQASANPTVIYNTTSYPISLSMGSTWNPELTYRVSSEISDEAREVTRDNRYELTYYSPTVNLLRDLRWGRADETYGEDPYHNAMIASQFVNGMEGKNMQGERLDPNGYLKTVSTIKHYLGNNSESNRLNGTSNMSERELREYYSYVYRLIVEQTDVSSVMAAYNRVNEVPANLNNYILDTLLRQTFGFGGYVTADCDSVAMAFAGSGFDRDPVTSSGNGHGWRSFYDGHKLTAPETVAWAINAGGDLECNNGYSNGSIRYSTVVPTAIGQNITTPSGIFDENSVDVSLLRLLTARMELGEFDVEDGVVSWYNDARARIAENYAPDWNYQLAGSARNNGADTITPERLELMLEAGHESLVLLKNAPVEETPLLPIQVPQGDYKVVVVGASPYVNLQNQYLGGYTVNMSAAGQAKMVRPWEGIRDGILAKNPNADVSLIGLDNKNTAISEDQLNSLADADLVIFYAGSNRDDAHEDVDRTSLNLPGVQGNNAAAIVAKNPNTVVVMETSSPNFIGGFADDTPAIIWSCYNGMNKGTALADVLLGKENFSGRTSTVWFENANQMASTRSYRLTPGDDRWEYAPTSNVSHTSDTYTFGESKGRTYMYYDEAASGNLRYPFGYGLSYTNFEYSNLVVNGLTNDSIDANGTVNVSVNVKNTGPMDGAEVVQLYVATPGAPAALQMPIKRLAAFDKVEVPAGETVTVNLKVDIEDMAIFNEENSKFEVYAGAYQLQVGKDHKDIELTKDFAVTGTLTPKVSVVTAKAVQSGDKDLDIANRICFDLGKTIDPQLTISMSDDTLYGYVMKGQSTEIPSRFDIEYTSNRPGVVSVTDGVIRTRTSGVATITATVTDTATGSEEEAEFVVLVKAGDGPMLESLKINGTEVEGFEAGARSYLVSVPVGTQPSDYTVSATAMEGSEIVSITQLSAIPGEAKVTVTNIDTTRDYTIRFIYNEPQIVGLEATNGTVTATMNMFPDAPMSISDFTASIALDALAADPLQLSNMRVDEQAMTVTFDYPPVVKINRMQVVNIAVAYKSTMQLSTSFELEADENLAYSIMVDGQPLPDYNFATKSYTYTVIGDTMPVVTAESTIANMQPVVTQANALFESARVTFGTGAGAINFIITFVPDYVTRFTSLPEDWEILNSTDAASYAEYGVTIPASALAANNDFPSQTMNNMLQYNGSLDGDWEITAKITNDSPLTQGGYANYGIGLYKPGADLKLVQLSGGGNPSYQYTASFGSSGTHTAFNYTTAWLRLTKTGGNITGAISSNGVNFTNIRTITNAAASLDGMKLQMFATTNQSTTPIFNTTFEYIYIKKPADKSALQALIDKAKALPEAMYTPETWATLAPAIAEAEAVLPIADILQSEVDQATAALQAVIDALEYAVEYYEENQKDYLIFSSGWGNRAQIGRFSGHIAKQASKVGETLTFTFIGSYFELLSYKSYSQGMFDIYVDGVKTNEEPYDLYQLGVDGAFQYAVGGTAVPYGEHTVMVVITGRNPSSIGNNVYIDAVGIAGELVKPVNLTDDQAIVLNDAPVEIDVLANDGEVSGTLELVQEDLPQSGVAEIVNGKIVFTPTKMSVKDETFSYKVGDATATVTLIYADTIRYEETFTAVNKIGTWQSFNFAAYSGGSALRSSVEDDTITVEFYGSGIDLIGYKSWSRGIVDITIDGTTTTVDTFDMTYDKTYGQTIYSVSGLDREELHTLEIRVTGDRYFLASGNAIDIDAFVVHK
ncbi:MAG TPA: hypothetical protein DEQ02_05450 [Ruminococcaceae bacterium]|nr:hypothetical protein [Oscillospiraceae bacterium]